MSPGNGSKPASVLMQVYQPTKETDMKMTMKSGAAIAATAAALYFSGAVTTPFANAATDAKGHCVGANACKGQSACKSASNACKGQNGCKGKGFVEMTKDECGKIEGAKFVEAQADVPR
jgi:hypothetical protein